MSLKDRASNPEREEIDGRKTIKVWGPLDEVEIAFLVAAIAFVLILAIALIVKACQRSLLTSSFSKSKLKAPNLRDPLWPTILKNDLFFDRYLKSHVHAFLIDDDGVPWYKIISVEKVPHRGVLSIRSSESASSISMEEMDWKPLFWENFANRKAEKIMADGANLMLWDDRGYIHYRKAIKDKRSGKEDELYEFADKIEKTNYWFPGWSMTLVVLDHLSSRIRIPKKDQVAMAHRGFWNSFVQDRDTGKKYPEVKVAGGNTSLFRYDGEILYLADALAPGKYIKKFAVPEKLDRVRLCASASVVCLIGYHPSTKVWKGWWKLVDLDTLGFMPHVDFYTKTGTEWIEIPPVPSRGDPTLDMRGCVLLNRGDNQRELQLWFRSDREPETIAKASSFLERNMKWNTKSITKG